MVVLTGPGGGASKHSHLPFAQSPFMASFKSMTDVSLRTAYSHGSRSLDQLSKRGAEGAEELSIP
jgi:hypothetical protein